MKVEGFPYEVNVYGEDRKPVDESGGHARLAHGEHYAIQLKNEDSRRAKATITADGVKVGTWVVPAHYNGDTLIERPEDTAKKLTFFRAGSKEATAALLDKVSDENLGVINVSFEREEEPFFSQPRVFRFSSDSPMRGGGAESFGVTRGGGRLGAGGTGLSGASSQVFGRTSFTSDPDFVPVVVSLRLVHDPKRKLGLDVEPLEGHRDRANPVPPPVRRDRSPN